MTLIPESRQVDETALACGDSDDASDVCIVYAKTEIYTEFRLLM